VTTNRAEQEAKLISDQSGPLFNLDQSSPLLADYRVSYTDDSDPCCPVFAQRIRAYGVEHAAERFYSGPDADGWRIVKIELVRT